MLPPDILINDGAQEGPYLSDWVLLAEPIPGPLPWAPPFGGGLAEPEPLNIPPIDSLLALPVETGYINNFYLGSWLPGQDPNGYQISQQLDNRLTAPCNQLKRKFSAAAQEWDNREQNDEYYLAGESGDSLNNNGPNQASQHPSKRPTAQANLLKRKTSVAELEWDRRKKNGESSGALDELMKHQGLEEVKQHFLDIKSKVNICKKQDPDGERDVLKLERFNVVFQGNPGTGKTTVARLYAKFLCEVGILDSSYVKETSGAHVTLEGAKNMAQVIQNIIEDEEGGTIFIDEAYQLMAPYVNQEGKKALDVLLTALENNIGSLCAIFVGYKDEMSRIPYTIHFADFEDGELWKIFADKIKKQYGGCMRIQGGLEGLYVRTAIRRLAQARGSRGFGNARAIENLLARIRQRQARRLTREKNEMPHQEPDYLMLTQEDLIGPDPSVMARSCPAWIELQGLIGLEQVKQSAARLIGMIELNYHKELRNEPPLQFPLNQIFVRAPSTGKTTGAKLYGQMLVDLGYLSRGDVVLKTPADFIGECLGSSEAKTKMIFESTVSKVLVIDEAYMLDADDSDKEQDKFKTGIIDTIVSMTQGAPGEDRCIVLVGYEDKIRDLFQNANPGLSRRFPVNNPFRFQDFTIDQLEKILRLKMSEENLTYNDDAIIAARELLTQALMRPKFTNAGEISSMLSAAKMNYETRISRLPLQEKFSAAAFEGIDFDPEFYHRGKLEPSCDKMLEGLVDSRIIDQLMGYQRSYYMARKANLDPRTFVATNFVFKGPPGTGKRTAARHMGKIFYDMGFISTKEVIECSATDLIGQYVGQTAPKTRKKLQSSLGRVLVISDSGRLMGDSFAAQAVEELLQFLANPSHSGKIVVVLTGLATDINKLLEQHPVLFGLFSEEIIFEALQPDDCIRQLLQELQGSGVNVRIPSLANSSSEDYCKVRQLFRSLGALSGWSNARDVKNIAKQIIRQFFNTSDPAALQHGLSIAHVTDYMNQAIIQRRSRAKASFSTRPSHGAANSVFESQQQPVAAPQSRSDIYSTIRGVIDTKSGPGTTAQPSGLATYKTLSEFKSLLPPRQDSSTPLEDKMQQSLSGKVNASREEGVSDEDWKSFEEKKDEPNIELCRNRLKKIQNALQAMGRCEAGYCWTKQEGGYRCEGGSHFVSDKELSERL
ncbi:P-loop containing nucleoside triphosphate hydrolase protein [Trichoderma chlorosporum]